MGDFDGHPFRGNQYTAGGGADAARAAREQNKAQNPKEHARLHAIAVDTGSIHLAGTEGRDEYGRVLSTHNVVNTRTGATSAVSKGDYRTTASKPEGGFKSGLGRGSRPTAARGRWEAYIDKDGNQRMRDKVTKEPQPRTAAELAVLNRRRG